MARIEKKVVGLTVIDDGTNTIISFKGKKLFRFKNSDNQLQVEAGIDTDTTL